MSVTIIQVAKVAKVSQSTVSQVLNSTRTTVPISPVTRQKVMDAAEKLGYRPNPMAQSLRTGRSYTIGIVCNAPENHWRMLGAAETLSATQGFDAIVSLSQWNEPREEIALRRLLNRRVDGILLLSPSLETAGHALLASLAARKFPLVGVGTMMVPGVDFVDSDRVTVYRRLTEHLLEQGCRRFLAVGGWYTPAPLARIQGIQEAVAACPPAIMERLKNKDGKLPGSLEEIRDCLRQRLGGEQVDAMICLTDAAALVAIDMARERGLRVPADIAVAGAGNTEWSAVISPSLTTIQSNESVTIAKAMERLFARIREPDIVLPPLAEHIEMSLVVRESSLFKKNS